MAFFVEYILPFLVIIAILVGAFAMIIYGLKGLCQDKDD